MSTAAQFVLAHLAVMACWCLIAACLAGIGLLYRGLFLRRTVQGADWYVVLWVGYAVTIAILQLWHFVRPVDGWLTAALGAAACAGLVREWSRRPHGDQESRPRWSSAGLVVAFALACWMANSALAPVTYYDGGSYHIPSIEWFNAYPVVLGLGNLNSRLASNTSSLLFAALLDVGALDGRAFHVTSGVLLAPVAVHALAAIRRLHAGRAREPAGDVFAASLLVPVVVAILIHEPSSTDTDLPVTFMILAVGELLVRVWARASNADAAERRWHLAALTLMTVASVTLKLSAALLAPAMLTVGMWMLRADTLGARSIVRSWLLPAILATGWLARGVALSGYPLYPSTLLPFPVDWRLPTEQLAAEAAVIRYGTRVLNQSPTPIGGAWFGGWLTEVLTTPANVFIVVLPLMLAAGAAVALRHARGRLPKGVIALCVAPAVGLLFWMAAAPTPRFGAAPAWLLAATSISLVSLRHDDPAWRARWTLCASRGVAAIIGAFLVVQAAWSPISFAAGGGWTGRPTTLGGLLIRPGVDHGIHPVGRSIVSTYVTRSGLALLVPREDVRCWRTALPCTPYPSPHLALRTPGLLRDGFRAEGGRWDPLNWPNARSTFLPYWRCLRTAPAEDVRAAQDCFERAKETR